MCFSIRPKIEQFLDYMLPKATALIGVAGLGCTAVVAKEYSDGNSLDEKMQSLFLASLFCDTSFYFSSNILGARDYAYALATFCLPIVAKQGFYVFSLNFDPDLKNDAITRSALSAMVFLGTASALNTCHQAIKALSKLQEK